MMGGAQQTPETKIIALAKARCFSIWITTASLEKMIVQNRRVGSVSRVLAVTKPFLDIWGGSRWVYWETGGLASEHEGVPLSLPGGVFFLLCSDYLVEIARGDLAVKPEPRFYRWYLHITRERPVVCHNYTSDVSISSQVISARSCHPERPWHLLSHSWDPA